MWGERCFRHRWTRVGGVQPVPHSTVAVTTANTDPIPNASVPSESVPNVGYSGTPLLPASSNKFRRSSSHSAGGDRGRRRLDSTCLGFIGVDGSDRGVVGGVHCRIEVCESSSDSSDCSFSFSFSSLVAKARWCNFEGGLIACLNRMHGLAKSRNPHEMVVRTASRKASM